VARLAEKIADKKKIEGEIKEKFFQQKKISEKKFQKFQKNFKNFKKFFFSIFQNFFP